MNIIGKEIPNIIPDFEERKFKYIIRNFFPYHKYPCRNVVFNSAQMNVIKNLFNTIKIDYRLNDTEILNLENTINMLNLIHYNLKNSISDKQNKHVEIQFKYNYFKFLINKDYMSVCCDGGNFGKKTKIIYKVVKYLIYTNQRDELHDKLEKYYLGFQID